MTIKAVLAKNWGNCPHCSSGRVQAVVNGFRVDDIPTDLMTCYDCEQSYVVYPDCYLKGKPQQQAEYPQDITVEISDAINSEKERLLSAGSPRIARKYRALILEEVGKGPIRFSEFVRKHPQVLGHSSDLQGLLNVLYYADEYLPEDSIQTGIDGGQFSFETQDGCRMSGDDLVIMQQTGVGRGEA